MALHNIVVVGATGHVGAFIVQALLEDKAHFTSITALTQTDANDAKFSDLKTKGVKVIQTNFEDHAALVHALKGADAVVSAVGVIHIKSQNNILEAAVEAGVKRFIPSDFAHDPRNPTFRNHPLMADKLVVTKRLEELAHQGKITYTSVSTGFFAEMVIKAGYLGFDLQKHEALLLDNGRHLVVFTSMIDIGRFTAATLRHPETSANKELCFNSFVSTTFGLLQAFERATGKKFTVKHSTTEESRVKADEAVKTGNLWVYFAETIRYLVFSGIAVITSFDNYLYPEVHTASLEDVVKSVLA